MPQKTADEALDRLREIRAEFSDLCEANGAVTEARSLTGVGGVVT
jgi:hypothetical protein